MGITRKLMSASTMGLVDFRSDRERIARKTAKGARAAKEQNRLLAQQNRILAQQQAVAARPATPGAETVADELAKLFALHQQGALTLEEFNAQKAAVLARPFNGP